VLPVVSSYGGIRVAATGKERRPLTVVQSPNPFDKGIGTIISSPYRSYFIGESFPVNMTFGNFAVILPCVPLRSEWTVVNGQPEGPAVKIGAPPNGENGWFGIEKVLTSGYISLCSVRSLSVAHVSILGFMSMMKITRVWC